MTQPFSIHSDITKAETLPGSFYGDEALFEAVKEKIFGRSWHCIGDQTLLGESNMAVPFTLLEGFMDEPLLLTRDDADELHCLSNVCTHRANLLVNEPGSCRQVACRYHGRRFGLDGKMKHMPKFEEAKNFPSDSDHLPSLTLERLGNLLFTSLDPIAPFEEWIKPVKDRIGFLPMEAFEYSPAYSASYEIPAHWALYVDNYLEGFHIPFVHPGLNEVIEFPEYTYELFPYANLQLAVGKEGAPVFDLPAGHQDHGKQISAYYFWLFPNLMLNFYPWGLSLNLVEPVRPDFTRVRFETWVWPEKSDLYDQGARELLHQTEIEDEEVVVSVQKGVRSRLYKNGRFSPSMEPAVHQFHQLLAKSLGK